MKLLASWICWYHPLGIQREKRHKRWRRAKSNCAIESVKTATNHGQQRENIHYLKIPLAVLIDSFWSGDAQLATYIHYSLSVWRIRRVPTDRVLVRRFHCGQRITRWARRRWAWWETAGISLNARVSTSEAERIVACAGVRQQQTPTLTKLAERQSRFLTAQYFLSNMIVSLMHTAKRVQNVCL